MKLNDEQEHPGLINGINEDGILSEDSLRQLSKSLAKLVPKDCVDIEDSALDSVRSLHQDLLQTAGSTRLSPEHGSAALNSLCGFLERCGTSSAFQLRDLCSEASLWAQAFEIFLQKSESNKAKPVRRLLLTLTTLLSKCSTEKEVCTLTQYVVNVTARAIRKQERISSIKPAIQALEHFIQQRLVNAYEILSIATRQARKIQALQASMASGLVVFDLPPAQWIDLIDDFVFYVLDWVQYPDCAPAVGRFLPTLFKSLHADKKKRPTRASSSQQPLWIYPVKQALRRRPGLLEVYENHILPGLLRLGAANTNAFLETLPVDEILHGNVGEHEVADIQLCLLIARIGAGSNFEQTKSEHAGKKREKGKEKSEGEDLEEKTEVTGVSAPKQSVWIDSELVGIKLLEHAVPNVRIAALSLLVSSPTSTKSFSPEVFRRLRVCLPFFHVEVNPKTRNEFVAVMKRFCFRLRGATISLLRCSRELGPKEHDIESGIEGTATDITNAASDLHEELDSHLAFRRYYLLFLLDELRPTASYQSHITALKILRAVYDGELAGRSSISKVKHNYFRALAETNRGGMHLRPLSDLLLDPFDDVRQIAAEVLEIELELNLVPGFPSESGEIEDEPGVQRKDKLCRGANGVIHSALSRAESKAANTGRADHADGVGRLYKLLYSSSLVLDQPTSWYDCNFLIIEHLLSALEDEVKVAARDLPLAVGCASLHGHLIALRYIAGRPDYFRSLHASTSIKLEKWQDFNQRIFLVCSFVWVAVANVLCFDAPEGHALDDDEVHDTDLGPTDTLSFCWRALKESSSLLNTILMNKGYSPSSPSEHGLQHNDFLRIGNLSFTQLAELRHRGAFSTVSHTFAACCVACAESSNRSIANLPWDWYQRTLECIQESASALTRRSAGIPAMITGILAAHPSEASFSDVVHDLQAIADDPIYDPKFEGAPLPQVHALNCLKDVFTDAQFGSGTEVHMADTIEIACSCLESHVWAIRNCGLMLFKALLRRLNGGTDTASTKVTSSHRQSSQLVYEKYPNIPILVLRLLQHGSSQNGHPSAQAHKIFPALEIIERSGIPLHYQAEVTEALFHHAESPDWCIREKAAKALSYILGDQNLYEEAKAILTRPNLSSQNALHGRLLCLQFLIARAEVPLFGEILHTYESIVVLLMDSWRAIAVSNRCPVTTAAFLNIRADLFKVLLQSGSLAAQGMLSEARFVSKNPSLDSSHKVRGPIMALQNDAFQRCVWLDLHARELSKNNVTYGRAKLSRDESETVLVLDEARRNMSDEGTIAILRHNCPILLSLAADLMRPTTWSLVASRPPQNPRHADIELALGGQFLGMAYGRPGFQKKLDSWIRQLLLAGSESSELCTRLAAARSLMAFITKLCICEDHQKTLPELLGVYLALIDILTDDDEDVRDQGARTVSLLISYEVSKSTHSAISLSFSPPAAKRRLTHFLEEFYRASKELWREAVERLAGIQTMRSAQMCRRGEDHKDSEGVFQLRPVVHLSILARKPQLAVFVQEKQNLYIDTAREADEWATTAVHLHPDAWDPDVFSTLEAWTIDGLAHFIETYEDHIDGALSPSSKPEVYTLLARVIFSARVLMSRDTLASGSGSGKGNAKENVCKGLLEKLLELGKQRLSHELLLDRIEWILEGVAHPSQSAWGAVLRLGHAGETE